MEMVYVIFMCKHLCECFIDKYLLCSGTIGIIMILSGVVAVTRKSQMRVPNKFNLILSPAVTAWPSSNDKI